MRKTNALVSIGNFAVLVSDQNIARTIIELTRRVFSNIYNENNDGKKKARGQMNDCFGGEKGSVLGENNILFCQNE